MYMKSQEVLKKIGRFILVYAVIVAACFTVDFFQLDANILHIGEIKMFDFIAALNGFLIPLVVLYIGKEFQEKETSRRAILRLESLFKRFVILNQHLESMFARFYEISNLVEVQRSYYVNQYTEYIKLHNLLLGEYGLFHLYSKENSPLDILDKYLDAVKPAIESWRTYKKNENMYDKASKNPDYSEYYKSSEEFLNAKWGEKVEKVFIKAKESIS